MKENIDKMARIEREIERSARAAGVGYADPAAKPAPLHTIRKSVSEIVKEL